MNVVLFSVCDIFGHFNIQTGGGRRSDSMLNVQQIIGLLLAGFSVTFMLWFLGNLIRESRSRYPRHAHPPVEGAESWQFRAISPQVPNSSVRAPHNSGKGALHPAPQFVQSSRSLRSASR